MKTKRKTARIFKEDSTPIEIQLVTLSNGKKVIHISDGVDDVEIMVNSIDSYFVDIKDYTVEIDYSLPTDKRPFVSRFKNKK